MRQAIRFKVPVDEGWDAGDRLQVFTDGGTGAIDLTKPLLVRGHDVFPGRDRLGGVGRRPVGVGRVGDSRAARPRGGIGRTRVGVTPVGTAPPFVTVVVDVPAAFGAWKFAVQAIGADGVVQSAALVETTIVVSGTDPDPLDSLTINGFDQPSSVLTFDFA